MLDDGASRLLRPEARGYILPAFPRAGVAQPALCIAAILQPPAQVCRRARIQVAQPLPVASPTKYLVATPERETPFRGCTTNLPVVSNHVKAAVLAHTWQIRARRRLEMAQNRSGCQFRIGITEEKRIHGGFRKHRARSLNLHSVPNVRNDARRRAHHHAQRFKVVDDTTPPVRGPIARELRRLLPERFIGNTLV